MGSKKGLIFLTLAICAILFFRMAFPRESELLSRTLLGADATETLTALGQTVTEKFEHEI